jgi:opacity protein-like surface antigen
VQPEGPQLPGRWSIGLNMHSSEFTAEDSGESAQFDGGGLAIRYRPWRKVDLELSLGGGRQTVEGYDGERMDGELAMATGTLAARYHFNQEQHWNFWLLFGVGATTIARHDASDEEIDAAQRPHVALGAGLEYRFTNFALQLEARVLGLGQTEDEKMLQEQGVYTSEGISGGSISLGASYYFGSR